MIIRDRERIDPPTINDIDPEELEKKENYLEDLAYDEWVDRKLVGIGE